MVSTTSELTSLTGAPGPGRAGGSFAFGKPARWRGSIARALASSLDVRRPERRGARRPALPQTLAKLLVWIVAGIAGTSAATVGLGVVVVRVWNGAFG